MRILVLARHRDSCPSNPNMDAFKMSKKKITKQITNSQFAYVVYLWEEENLINYVDKQFF